MRGLPDQTCQLKYDPNDVTIELAKGSDCYTSCDEQQGKPRGQLEMVGGKDAANCEDQHRQQTVQHLDEGDTQIKVSQQQGKHPLGQ